MADPDPIAPFDATVAGVRSLVPKRPIGDNTKPSTTDVASYLVDGTDAVAGLAWHAIDPLDNVTVSDDDGKTDRQRAIDHARSVVHLYGGAMAEDAAYPEQSGRQSTGHGGVLWTRYRHQLDALLVSLGLAPIDAEGPRRHGDMIGHGPEEPLLRRDVRW